MLHAAHHFLADIAALLEVDPFEDVEGDIVGESVIGEEIGTLFENARGDAGAGIGLIVAPIGARLHRRDDAPAQRHRPAPVGMGEQARLVGLGIADAVALAHVGYLHLRAQAVHLHALEEIVGHRMMHVEPERVLGPAGGALGQDLALGREQRPPGGGALAFGDDAGQHVVEQLVRLWPGETEDGAVGAEMDGHDLLASRTEPPLNRPYEKAWRGPRHGAVRHDFQERHSGQPG